MLDERGLLPTLTGYFGRFSAQTSINRVTVSLQADRRYLNIRIEDRGSGFDPSSVLSGMSGGLRGMRERAFLLGGELTMDSAPGKGTRVNARLPLIEK